MTRAELTNYNNQLIAKQTPTDKITALEHRTMNEHIADYVDDKVSEVGVDSGLRGIADVTKSFSSTTDYPLYDAGTLNVYRVDTPGDYNAFAGTTALPQFIVDAVTLQSNYVSFYRQPNGGWSVSVEPKQQGPIGPPGPSADYTLQVKLSSNTVLANTQNLKTIIGTAAITLTVPTGLDDTYCVALIADGGDITMATSGTTFKHNAGKVVVPNGRRAVLTRESGTENYYLAGDLV